MSKINTRPILSPYFLLGILVLLLNDFVLKANFGNTLTGKLSDVAGLFVFPIFLTVFAPTRRIFIFISTAVSFVIWKSPLSQPAIELWNANSIFNIGRTVDYTDLIALLILPVSYYCSHQTMRGHSGLDLAFSKRILASFIVLLSIFAFTATTLTEDRTAYIEREYSFKLTKSEIESVLKTNESILDLKIERETDVFPANQYPDVKTDPNTYFADFKLNQKYCNSPTPEFNFIIQEQKAYSKIKFGHVNFRCKDDRMKPNVNSALKQYQQEFLAVFEREVVEKLAHHGSQ